METSGIERSAAARQRPKPRLLVVDDERAVRTALARFLGTSFDVDTASDAESAFLLICDREYDVVISDYDMPGRDGLWLLRQIRIRCPRTLRVLHSGSDPENVSDHLREGLVDRFIAKPMCIRSLLWLCENARRDRSAA